jgi:hypothetical protein
MPRHFGIRKRRELKGKGIASNLEKLEKDFAEQIHFGKAEETKMDPEAIKKKFSI